MQFTSVKNKSKPWKLALIALSLLATLTAALEDSPILPQDIIRDPKFQAAITGNTVAGRYIVEFDDKYSGSSSDFLKRLTNDINRDDPNIGNKLNMTISHEYDSTPSIFHGVSLSIQPKKKEAGLGKVQTASEENIVFTASQNHVVNKLVKSNYVKKVYPVTIIPRPEFTRTSLAYDESILPIINSAGLEKALPFSHEMTQVSRVHKELGLTGKGVLVGIIDSGIDYTHPSLGGGFGPGFKVKYGADLSGDFFDVNNPAKSKKGKTPLDTCNGKFHQGGHGTHVAGIIAAEDTRYNFTGVAPDVSLGMWRVFGCQGSTSSDLVINALILAYEAGCDVINLSLGGATGWGEDPTAVVANRIAKSGVVVVAAAGNAGSDGPFMVASPSVADNVISVASVDNDYVLLPNVLLGNGDKFDYSLSTSTKTFPNGTIVAYADEEPELLACGQSEPSRSLTGQIVLIKRGNCTFDEKSANAYKAGATAVLVFDNELNTSSHPVTAPNAQIPVASVSNAAGVKIMELLGNNIEELEAIFEIELSASPSLTARKISSFSSVGTSFELDLKPNVAGVGGSIFSLLPVSRGSYGVLSGTSMASPYVAGAVALYLQAHPKHNSSFIAQKFQNFALPSFIDNPAKQGAGLIQVYDSIKQLSYVSPGQLSFNDTIHRKEKTLAITNKEIEAMTYTIRHFPNRAIAPFNISLHGYTPIQPTVYTKANVTADIGLSLKTVTVPYVGVSGNVAEIPIFPKGFPMIIDYAEIAGTHVPGKPYQLKRIPHARPSLYSVFRLLIGTARLTTEILDENHEFVGNAFSSSYMSRNTLSPGNFLVVNSWNGSIIDEKSEALGETIPLKNGTYYMRWKALRLLADPDLEDSWMTSVSDPIAVS
ncbi:peptidase S8/S53 domain-containing protein [Phycomyces nitens]|nr:peptidase S8/S53 domain-containing protein [Phycomyces nitens]